MRQNVSIERLSPFILIYTNKKRHPFGCLLFMVTRTRIAKASLADLLRKYPILCPFRLRLWRTAERWTIEFDSLFIL